jgi:hypothetical protein
LRRKPYSWMVHFFGGVLLSSIGCFPLLWCPRFLINPNSRSTQLTVVKARSTWALTPKNSLTYSSDPLLLVNTLVGPTHGQRLGQTPLTPSVHRCLPELLPRSPKFI